MKKIFSLVLVMCLLILQGCAGEKNTDINNEDNNVITENVKVVKPLSDDLNVKNLNDRTFAAGFEKSDIYLENNSRLVINDSI